MRRENRCCSGIGKVILHEMVAGCQGVNDFYRAWLLIRSYPMSGELAWGEAGSSCALDNAWPYDMLTRGSPLHATSGTSLSPVCSTRISLLNALTLTGQADSRRHILTIRRKITQMLREGEYTAQDISRILGIREKEVYEHLPHVERSAGPGTKLIVDPARCLTCGFVFAKRKRFTSPGRCPVCRSESITRPVFAMQGGSG